jgi:hypothetical protein
LPTFMHVEPEGLLAAPFLSMPYQCFLVGFHPKKPLLRKGSSPHGRVFFTSRPCGMPANVCCEPSW